MLKGEKKARKIPEKKKGHSFLGMSNCDSLRRKMIKSGRKVEVGENNESWILIVKRDQTKI